MAAGFRLFIVSEPIESSQGQTHACRLFAAALLDVGRSECIHVFTSHKGHNVTLQCSQDDWTAALDDCVAELLAEASVAEPPVDALHIAAKLGFVVALDVRQACRARYARLNGGDTSQSSAIMLRPEPRRERRQWAVAHEIGERYAHAVFARLNLGANDAPIGTREHVANALANRLLLPSPWFVAEGERCRWDLAILKQRFRTASYELIARRMLDADGPAVVTIFDHGTVSFRRNNAGLRVAGLSQKEREAWHAAHYDNEIVECRDHGMWIRAWPIHEPNWKREIVRTEPMTKIDDDAYTIPS